MATLSGNKIKDTYQSLVKFSDNGNITTSAKQLTDGFGNNSPLYVSTTQVGIGVTPEATYDLHVYSNAKVGGNLTITGDLTVNGTTTTIDTQTLTVEDPLIEVASDNTSTDVVDIGWYGKYAPSGTTLYAGMFRDTGDGKFKIFKSLEEQPTTTVNTSGTGYTKADLVIGNLETTQVDLRDDEKIRLGDNQELEIYHFNNDYSWIKHSGTQALFIQSDELNIRSNQGTETMITASYNGSVDLWYDASKKLETTSTGVTVTGAVSATTFSGQLDGTISSATTAVTQSDGDNSTKVATTAYVDTAIQGHDTLAEVLAGGNTSGANDIIMEDSQKVNYGTDSDLQIYHDATDSYIKNDTGNLIIEQTTDDADIVFKNDDGSGGTIEYFRIDGSESRVVYGRSIHMADNVSIFLGNDDDGLIRYDSTANKILYTGTSQFSSNVDIDATLEVDDLDILQSASLADNKNFDFGFNTHARFGDPNAGVLKIWSNSSNYNFIQSESSSLIFYGKRDSDGTIYDMMRLEEEAGVRLYYNDVEKFVTTNTGVSITGNATFTGNIQTTQITATNGLNYLKRDTDASLQLRSENTRSGLFITKPATDTVMRVQL